MCVCRVEGGGGGATCPPSTSRQPCWQRFPCPARRLPASPGPPTHLPAHTQVAPEDAPPGAVRVAVNAGLCLLALSFVKSILSVREGCVCVEGGQGLACTASLDR